MGSDNDTISDDSRKKHRRSSDGDTDEEKGKRRKHHRHHHRRHHRSKKHDDVESVKKDYEDMEEGEIVEEDGEKLATHLPASGAKDAYSPDSVVSLQGQTAWRDSDENQKEKSMDIDKSSLGDSVNGHDVVSILPPYQDRIPDELSFRKISESSYPLEDTDHKLNRKRANDSDEDIRFRHEGSEHFRASRSEARDKEREPNVKYSRSADRRDAKYADDISHRESIDGDVDRGYKYEREKGSSRDDRREKERKKSRNRERVKDEDKQLECDVDEKIVNYTESEMTIEREQKHRRERDKVIENDKTTRRASEWVSNRDTEVLDRHRERENDQCRNKEREKDRQRKRSVDRARDRDNGRQRDISKSKGNDSEGKNKDWSTDRDREKERVRERSVDRATERKREGSHRERENGQDTSRDRYWDAGRNKYRGGSSKQDRHSEYQRYDNSHIHDQVKTKSEDTSKLVCSKNSVQGFEDMHKREEEEHEEYQEKISLQLADEEDDVNKIQEESRRRRQAILEKYKNMMVQDQTPQSADIDKGNDQERLSIQQTEPLTSSSEFAYDKTGASLDVAKSPAEKGESAANHTGTRGLGEGTPKSEISDDMFCDDIFGDTPTGVIKTGKRDSLPVERSGLHDNWDDAEGYYSYRFGELLEGRYEITAAHGKGVFSSVVRAKDLKAGHGEPEEVAIKIIRNNDTMFKAGQSELIILKKLVGADPEDRRHCVRFLSSFMYRNHLCLVFESLHMNLREVLKKFGRNIGLKLTAVRAYAKQLLIALKHLRNCGVLHCDIKPDNMLVNESKNVLKLCDFGNAMFAGKNEITPYLVSRFYRAPEIILGLSYDHPVDIWSVGCCLYELYTGKVLFPGATNNDMIRLHLELKGPFPKKMLRKGAFTEQHFDQDLNFQSLEDDPVTKKTIKRVMVNIKPKDIGNILTGSPGEDPRMLTNFKDLLDKIFILDPDKRMTVSQALAHPFITGK